MPPTIPTSSRSWQRRSERHAGLVTFGRRGDAVAALGRCGLALAFGLAGTSVAGCSKAPAPDAAGEVRGVPAPAAAGGAAPAVAQRTTNGDIALDNLSARIAALEEQLERSKGALPVRAQLVDLLLSRTQFLSTFSDFARVDQLCETAPETFPGEPKAFLLRARARAAVHRFAEAESDLKAAEALGALARDTEAPRASLHIAQGRELAAALATAERRAQALPTLDRLSLQAAAEAALGRFDAADEHYRAALASLHDVSPFPFAYVEFQRGVMWAELADQPERALSHYVEAVRLLPRYVVANVHLAELEAALGRQDAAEQRLLELAGQKEDPEPWGRLAELLLAKSASDPFARGLLERAAQRYDELLARYPSAFADHASEFFAGPGGNPARAVALARNNLLLRQTGRAYLLAVQSAVAAGDTALACQYLAQVSEAARANRNLRALMDTELARCGQR